jgi:hypothetical protein
MIERLGRMIGGWVGLTIDRIGYVSVGSGFWLWFNYAAEKAQNIALYILPSWPQDWTEWAAAGSTAGAATFAIKNIVEMYLKIRNRSRKNADNDTN